MKPTPQGVDEVLRRPQAHSDVNAAKATMFRSSGTYRRMADCLKKSRKERPF
jgi:hypothetical protein